MQNLNSNKAVMKFDGAKLLKDLKRLDAVKSMRDVTNITYTQFPGAHCPLMGALLVVRGIKDSLAFIVGTDECVYYSKSVTMAFDGFGGLEGRCVSVHLDTNDVTFGSAEKVEESFKEIIEDYKPSCVFLISTCVIEIIGDDIDAMAKRLNKEHNIPVLPVHTEHFKCEDHLPGIERTLAACTSFMEKQENNASVNILGQRFGDFTKSELHGVLEKEEIEINMQLPKNCLIDDIRGATKACLNIVVNETALGLAKNMHEKFDIPYIVFDKSCSHESNLNAYKELFAKVNKEVPAYIFELYEKCKKKYEESKGEYEGLTYIFGGSPFSPYEHIKLMCELGLEPLLLQVSELDEKHYDDIAAITAHYNPFVTRTANVAGMSYVYDYLRPALNFGPAYQNILAEKNITQTEFKNSSDMIGFELCEIFMQGLEKAKINAQKIKETK